MSEYKLEIPRGLVFKVEDDILYNRYKAVMKNPDLKITNRWDQSDVFYNTRKKLDAMGYDVTKLSDKRKIINQHIKNYCDRNSVKRHEVGIFAADRAVMAFQGKLHSVSFENYKQLAHLGVDIVLIEKEGTVDKLVPFTSELDIALVQSEGFVSEYGVMLAQEAKKQGVNLAILTDFDASGILLAHKINGAIRLGIDLGVIDEFNAQRDEYGNPFEQLDRRKLRESYIGGDHWTYFRNLSKGAVRDELKQNSWWKVNNEHDTNYMKFLNTIYMSNDGIDLKYIDFIEHYRIELNTIMDEVGAQRFWYWLKDKLIKTFPKRDYNRAIPVPDYVLTDTMNNFIVKLKVSLSNKLENNVSDIRRAYVDTNNGFLDTTESLKYAKQYLKNKLENDEEIMQIDSQLQDLIDGLD
ncbi:MAG TPA: hypothetical protein VJ772_02380 [Nitrososphaeraceae archaeon]|nr:hypothetical protein [Nitrososphaeraceae archaeon]